MQIAANQEKSTIQPAPVSNRQLRQQTFEHRPPVFRRRGQIAECEFLPVGEIRIVGVIPIPGWIGTDAGHAYKQVTVSHHLGEHQRRDLLKTDGGSWPEPSKLPWKCQPERSRFRLVRLRRL